MYLEISKRQTGKTLRLIKAAVEEYYTTGIPPYIIIINEGMASSIRRYVPSAIEVITQRRLVSIQLRDNDRKLFYDEFDFINDIIYNRNNYYSTSASSRRGSISTLLGMNEGHYDHYYFNNGKIDHIYMMDYKYSGVVRIEKNDDDFLDMFRID